MIKHSGKWAHTENPLEMSFPFQLSTLITLLQQLRGCFISFYAGLPVFANSFFLFFPPISTWQKGSEEPSTETV